MTLRTKNKLRKTGLDVASLIGRLHYEGVDQDRLKRDVQELAKLLNEVILHLANDFQI